MSMTADELEHMQANTNKLLAEVTKLLAEREKLEAERDKLTSESDKLKAEQRKLLRETVLYPFAVAIPLVGAIAAMMGLLLKLLS